MARWIVWVCLAGCSGNVLERFAPADLAGEAQQDMQDGAYAVALGKLNTVLLGNPQDYNSMSLLAAAQAAIGGILVLDLVEQGAVTGGGGSLTQVLASLPPATATTLAHLQEACATMGSIPVVSRTPEMELQTSLFQSLLALLLLKSFQGISLQSLTEADAEALVTALASAALAASYLPIPGLAVAGDAQAAIEAAPGSTTSEKVASFVSSL